LYTDIQFEDPGNVYLGFFQDLDGENPLNWVRSGTTDETVTFWNSNHFEQPNGTATPLKVFFDPQAKYVTGTSFYGGGGMVPYILTSSLNSYNTQEAGHGLSNTAIVNGFEKIMSKTYPEFIGSVDIVLTTDKSKWSRCPVFETHNANAPGEPFIDEGFPVSTQPENQDLRFSFSVDQDGTKNFSTVASTNPDDANYISPYGMGWFPGYAIDVETGERLNIAFGEDSYLSGENGRDMLFNPSKSDPTSGNNEGYYSEQFGDYLLAGKHYIYLFESNAAIISSPAFPNYDAGVELMNQLTDAGNNNYPITGVGVVRARNVWRNCVWAGIPFNVTGKTWLGGEVRIKLRVQKPYQKDYSMLAAETAPENDNNPLYEFSFDGMQTITNSNPSATSALDLIQVVPNPYYSASEYETMPLDNRVKIVNLPDECDISIYTLNGTLIRTYIKRSNESTSLVWDLKNFKGLPISTGLYIIHVKAPGIGEKILKWYGVMRPIQTDNY
jgi:hypothetical protein